VDFVTRTYVDLIPTAVESVLGIDLGGTNCNCGVFVQQNGSPVLVLSLHSKSQEIISFSRYLKDLLQYLLETYQLSCATVCIAAAGIISVERDQIVLTNLPFVLSCRELYQSTALKKIYLVNDFEIIFYGIQSLNQKDLLIVNPGVSRARETCAIIGAGTGLGKSIVAWDESSQAYLPLLSEGGHADFAVHTAEEYALIEYIMKIENRTACPSWEDLLSGKGIERIYAFFRKQNIKDPVANPHPDTIFANRDRDESSAATYRLYAQFYGRCAKNFALETMCRAGLYIAGGIAAHNTELFLSRLFLDEFFQSVRHHKLLQEIRVTVVADYNVSLYGAAIYAYQKEQKEKGTS
jgi:glucokinase